MNTIKTGARFLKSDYLPSVETELNHLTNLACVDFHRKVGKDEPCPGVGDPLTKAQLTAMKIAGRVPCNLHWIGSHTLIPGIRSMAEECDHHPQLLRDDEEYELA